jgi:hypothetical protein
MGCRVGDDPGVTWRCGHLGARTAASAVTTARASGRRSAPPCSRLTESPSQPRHSEPYLSGWSESPTAVNLPLWGENGTHRRHPGVRPRPSRPARRRRRLLHPRCPGSDGRPARARIARAAALLRSDPRPPSRDTPRIGRFTLVLLPLSTLARTVATRRGSSLSRNRRSGARCACGIELHPGRCWEHRQGGSGRRCVPRHRIEGSGGGTGDDPVAGSIVSPSWRGRRDLNRGKERSWWR